MLFTILFLTLCLPFSVAAANEAGMPNAYADSEQSYSDQLRPRKRGQSLQMQLPSAWSIDVNQGGNLCYVDPEQVLLWRDDVTFASHLSIKVKGSDKPLNLRWAKNQDTLKWPNKRVQLSPDQIYYTKLNQRDTTSQIITTKQLPEALWTADIATQAAWMRANGCALQADYLQQTTTQ